jgi:hypothetical protein
MGLSSILQLAEKMGGPSSLWLNLKSLTNYVIKKVAGPCSVLLGYKCEKNVNILHYVRVETGNETRV